MQVKIEEIQDKGLTLNEVIPPAIFKDAFEGLEGYHLKEATRFQAQLKKLSGHVLLHGAFEATVVAPCKRCLKDVELKVPVSFDINLVPEKKHYADDDEDDATRGLKGEDDGRAAHAGSFMLTDADSEPFDGKTIRLDPIIREQVVLALPVAVLCADDCKGLCTVCGSDLNVAECGCERKLVDIRLAKLRDIKLN